MTKKAKIWFITATCLVLIGCITFGGVMWVLEWDFTKLSTTKFETNNYEINEDYNNISIITKTADVVFTPCENTKTSVVCYEQKNIKHSVAVKDSTLIIEAVDSRKWYEHIGVNFNTPKITVNIPQGEYGALSVKGNTGNIEIGEDFKFDSIDINTTTGHVNNLASAFGNVKIATSTGNISTKNICANTLDLLVSTGKVTVSDVACEGDIKVAVSTGKANIVNAKGQNITSTGDTGDLILKNVIASGKLNLYRSTGNISFDGSDGAEIIIKTSTGSVKGSLLSDKVFITKTDTGRVDVPKTISGGKCEITTDTGNIIITVK